MPQVLFMSYARPRTAGPQAIQTLDRFDQDLRNEVGNLVQGDGKAVCFRDICQIEAGTDDWSTELAAQMRAYPVGLVLLSPAYLENDRPWCKWEYMYLKARNAEIERLLAAGNPDGKATPRLLLTLNWNTPDPRDVPPQLGQTQGVAESLVADGDEDDLMAVRAVQRKGLRAILELVEDDDVDAKRHYRRFIQLLGRYAVEQWRRFHDVEALHAGLPAPPAFDPQDSWTCPRQTNAALPPAPRMERRRTVYVVYLAAEPNAVPDGRRWRYLHRGESDWRAFAGPVAKGDEAYVDSFFSSLSGFTVEKWPFVFFREHLKELLKEAGQHSPVLFVVDPWTVTQLESYRAVLADYAKVENDFGTFSCPLVVWNEQDQECQAIRKDFIERVEGIFAHYRWEPVERSDEFADCVTTIIKGLQRKIRNALADATPDNGTPLPHISPTA